MFSQEEQWLLEEKYKGVESEAFHADCKRLAAGEPLAYVIGSIPFLDCTIYLDLPASQGTTRQAGSKPLIPRPETEFWVEKVIQEIKQQQVRVQNSNLRVLDLCAGSGCMGVATAKHLPGAHVDFAEIDPAHLPTIKKNITTNLLQDTVEHCRFFASDLFSCIPKDTQYDYILTNPPYIDPAIDRAEDSVKNHEPHLALYGGTAGMECIAKIIKEAPQYLKPNGFLYIEHEPEQVAAIAALATQHSLIATTHNDQYKVARYSKLSMAQ